MSPILAKYLSPEPKYEVFKDMRASTGVDPSAVSAEGSTPEFLFKLKKWQDEAMWQQQRFPFQVAWPPRLQRAVDLFKNSQAPNAAPGRAL